MKRKDSIFTHVPTNKVGRNYFDLSHEVKMSGKFGNLYPMLLLDTLPGDSIRNQLTVFLRAAPMLAPIMHRVDITTHFFFVPNRLVSSVWEDFITGGQDGEDSPILPYYQISDIFGPAMQVGNLWDYLGLPIWDGAGVTTSTERVSAIPFRAYNKVWNDYYRDPNFDAEIDLNLDLQGNVTAADSAQGMLNLKRHMWQKDYFTSALPWAQRGSEVLLPVSVRVDEAIIAASGLPPAAPGNVEYEAGGGLSLQGGSAPIWLEGDNASGSINDFRRAMSLQKWLENNARGGYRYIEQIESHYNVRVPDYRLQRAEYLGGGKQPITISEVLSTADTEDVPVGDLAGHGVSVGKTNRFNYYCQEHGTIIGILTVTPQTAYQQGIEKLWSRADKFDFAFPELAQIGEQEIMSKELFYSFDAANDDDNNNLFGYIPRYSEYKFKNDRVAGDFRTSLDFWHLGRIFTARPVLNAAFTTMNDAATNQESYRRVFANQDGTDYLWMQLFHRLSAKRPLPYFGVPKLVG